MPEWEDEKFRGLLTTNIWSSNIDTIEKVLKMPEWEDKKFQKLLTPSIWTSKYKAIKDKLYLPYWDNPDYQRLLSPSIFVISIKNINGAISLFEKYKIGRFITTDCLRKNTKSLKALFEYMTDNDIPLLIEKGNTVKLNPIIGSSKKVLKEKYNIDLDNIKKENEVNGKRHVIKI